ncbi:nicotinate (nicotinamide) nucleotide adenylyltransferase [Verrucomicrobiaceae bacterium N1E253]|uniref:Probable nicotinate-nucleotide adenylyltransferase n=1 Tax=Oceaniferula marina TaxID=2748318 RepID=A0A851GFP7_9BACT|nr:nicotinate (nicotinamide) nucleotide adenylyltransferase [Oceaniferula marina]NWK56029.1 nicotinate (nicotinamide) nucleotide adenylyltransferase [Oceaniferula marina]
MAGHDSQTGSPFKTLCLFGGTFDPIHLGHTHIAQAAVDSLGLDRVLFLPCGQSPHKAGQKHADAHHRLKMCQLATRDIEWAEVDDHDLTAPPPSYSHRLAGTMAKRYPGARLFWLMGTDQWKAFPHWHRPDELAQLVEFIVFSRGEPAKPLKNYRLHTIHGDHPAAATQIRNTPKAAKSWLHPAVYDYIQENRLYQHGNEQKAGEADD